MQDVKPKAGPKKRGYKAIPAGNYTPKNKIYLSSCSEIKYLQRTNNVVQYGYALIIRAELYRRGYTYRALYNLCIEKGFTFQLSTITAICNGASNRFSLASMYKLAFALGIDLHPLQIPEAIQYLRANGRSVKDF